jgi:hypothetical protein
MTWRERRRYFLAAERRVLAGEPKSAVLAGLTAAGDDRREAARTLARVVSASRRRRYRWPQRLLVALVVVAGVTSALSPLTNAFAEGRWFAVGVAWSALLFGLPLLGVLRWRSEGYTGAGLAGMLAFWLTLRPLLGDLSHLGLDGALTLSLYAALVVAGTILWRRLFPNVGWADGDPPRNADGEYLLVH